MNEELFRQWAAGDAESFAKAWELMWRRYYTWLVWFSAGLAQNDAIGEIWADDIWHVALVQVDAAVRSGRVRWMGAEKFDRYIRRRLRWRVRDRARKEQRAARPRPAPQPRHRPSRHVLSELRSINRTTRDILANPYILTDLRAVASSQPALRAVIEVALDYLRSCLVAALPDEVDPPDRTWRELAGAVEPERFFYDRRKRSILIMKSLGISRNVLDLRVRRLRALSTPPNQAVRRIG